MIVVATEPHRVGEVQDLLRAGGGTPTGASSPAPERCLVLAAAPDPWCAARLVADLRRHGFVAVDRPDAGPRLDAWVEGTRPVTFGGRVTVCSAWSEHDRAELPNVIELGLGGFGDGRHPTTRLIVEELLVRIAGGERVLDVGCGSGVLGLVALRLGAGDLVAADIDAASVTAARANAERNCLAHRVEATAAPLPSLTEPFDVVLANVARAAAVELAADLVRLVRPAGWLAVSGLSPNQCDQVAAFLRPLRPVRQREAGGWSCLVMARADDSAASPSSDS